jgi:hypothetical protein
LYFNNYQIATIGKVTTHLIILAWSSPLGMGISSIKQYIFIIIP